MKIICSWIYFLELKRKKNEEKNNSHTQSGQRNVIGDNKNTFLILWIDERNTSEVNRLKIRIFSIGWERLGLHAKIKYKWL